MNGRASQRNDADCMATGSSRDAVAAADAQGAGKAAITGDVILLGPKVNDAVGTRRSAGIAVTAILSHVPTEEPQILFLASGPMTMP
jgi:hypothetical protein